MSKAKRLERKKNTTKNGGDDERIVIIKSQGEIATFFYGTNDNRPLKALTTKAVEKMISSIFAPRVSLQRPTEIQTAPISPPTPSPSPASDCYC